MNLTEMITLYARLTAAAEYLLGFVFNGNLYRVTLSLTDLTAYAKISRMSTKKGGAAKVRIRLNVNQKMELVTSGKAVLMGSAAMLETKNQYNKGERFEKIIVEEFTGINWKKDSRPFWKCGDMTVNGKEVQIKLEEAELTNEKALTNALAQRA